MPTPPGGSLPSEGRVEALRPGGGARSPSASAAMVTAGVVGVIATCAALYVLHRYQPNVVRYVLQPTPAAVGANPYLPPILFASSIVLAMIATAVVCARPASQAAPIPTVREAAGRLAPLALNVPLGLYALLPAAVPPFFLTLMLVLSVGWAAGRSVRGGGTSSITDPRRPQAKPKRGVDARHLAALVGVVAAILVLTILHTRIQINFFEHFMLGHADFGHFTEELKNALAGRGLRNDGAENTRLGWHFVPLLYALVPGYALFPSPRYLMVCSALFVHAPAIVAYLFARRRTGSVLVGCLVAAAWLLLPSQSRLVYSNTYGFQWIYVSMVMIGALVAAGVSGRWRWAGVLVVVLLLTKETTTAVTFGWGLYVALFTARRRFGVVVMLASLAYLWLCVSVIIPRFAASGAYERFSLFGSLGDSLGALAAAPFTHPGEFFGRLIRRESVYFVLMLVVPMMLLPVRGWRVSVAALPTLILLLLLDNPQQIGIKFWHQATVLPVLFFAGIALLAPRAARRSACAAHTTNAPRPTAAGADQATRRRGSPALSASVSLVAAAAMAHYLFGLSPLSKYYEIYARDSVLQSPDPRFAFVTSLRERIGTGATVLATERLAAHFTDARRLYTGGRPLPADYVIIDARDAWDPTDLPRQVERFAADPVYELWGSSGDITVFRRRAPAPVDD